MMAGWPAAFFFGAKIGHFNPGLAQKSGENSALGSAEILPVFMGTKIGYFSRGFAQKSGQNSAHSQTSWNSASFFWH